jgi:iron complex outermembrane receptor protein
MHSSPPIRRTVLSLAIRSSLLGIALATAVPAMAQSAQSTPADRDYDIAPGALSRVLTQFAAQAGIQMSVEASLTAGRDSPGLRGRQSVQGGLNALLAGTGLEAVNRGGGEYTLRASLTPGVTTLPSVTVTGSATAALQQDGLASDGYRSGTLSSVGALGGMDWQRTPYAFNVVSRELLQNVQAQSPDDVYKISPSTLSQTPQISGWAPMVKIRGFNSYDRAEDGLRRSYGFAASLEDKERVEILNGLSGFLFGAASPGGMVNYVNKRPTAERLNSITVGNYGGSQYYVHGDFGGPVDSNGKVGYRVNLVRQDGDTAVDDQKIDRTLASAALDFNITDRFKLELGASYGDYKMQAPSSYWFFREGVSRPTLDTSKNWSQPWIRDETETRKWMARATYEASDNLTLRVAHIREYQDRPVQYHTMNSVRGPGEYFQLRQKVGPTRTESESWQALADISFGTGPVAHKITMGYYGYTDRQWQTNYFPSTGYLGPYGLDSPTHVAEPVWPSTPSKAMYFSSRVRNDNFMIGDLIRFNEQWSALVGINRSTIQTIDRDANGNATQPDYDRGRNSPNASLIFTPAPWLTTYATYIEGLEQGGIAPEEAVNRLQTMPPMQSKQKELGIKAELGGVLVSGALFDIEKSYEFTNSANVYAQDGIQRHRGGEVSAVGKVTEGWTIMGGATLLHARVEGGANDGQVPINVPKFMAKLYSEYALPFAPGLSVTGGVYHVGKQWATATNTSRLPSYTTFDLGLRYAAKVSGRPLTLRLNVNNLTGKDYWLNSYYLGSPRSVALSAQVQF